MGLEDGLLCGFGEREGENVGSFSVEMSPASGGGLMGLASGVFSFFFFLAEEEMEDEAYVFLLSLEPRAALNCVGSA